MPHQSDKNARQDGNAHHAPETAADEVLAEFEEAETRVGEADDRGHQGEEGDALTTNEEAQEETAKKKAGGSTSP
ncbi:hypothetical protein [Streptomyces decoyicus]|uniref:hypothetical protein n=1 Tax=Streptomyces decoyicus TaxID=249567 RepID=UPI00069E5172|nr:hypothetical protein [Streptomyces decoyicus]KOG42262.1 hypothetical protein ADK74_16805 [Streptomyces decoyicus]QZY13949.1 hypothetical protein K7C20_00620 [Streptomyces decoyicus]